MAFSFGAPSTTTQSIGFGNAAKPAFGNATFSFGSNTATTSATTGFGGFGANPATTNAGFGGFGNAPATTTAAFGAGNTGFGGFGAPQATSASRPYVCFGGPTTTTSTFSGFGTNTSGAFGTQTAFGQNTGFGAPNPGGFGAPGTGFGAPGTGFGTTTTGFGATGTGFGATGTGFGSSFGTGTGFGAGGTGFGGAGGFGTAFAAKPLGVPGSTTGFGCFGTGLGTFGQQPQQQQQQQQPAVNPHEALMNAVFNCNIFGDERDQILAQWNFLQAKWGVGKAYYSNNQHPIELTEQNPLCRFKAIGYSCLPSVTDRDGLVQLILNKTEEEIKNQQAQLVTSLIAIFGHKPNISINVDSIKAVSKTNAQAIIYINEKSVSGICGSKLPASEVSQFLNGPVQRQQLASMGVSSAIAHARPDARHLQEYLDSAPPGIDPRLWKQAQADNPDPEKYLPVPMIGFAEVKWRMQCQEDETRLHATFLSRAASELAELKGKHAAVLATLQDQTRRHMHLHHRLLAVVVRQESARRAGAAMTPEEEALRGRLEALHAQLTAPTQFNGRLSELLSQMRMQRCQSAGQSSEKYAMDQGSQEDIKQFLALQQKGMSHLIETVHKDLSHLNLIQESMTRIMHGAE